MTKLVMFKQSTTGSAICINPAYVVMLRDGGTNRTHVFLKGFDAYYTVDGDVADVAKRLIHD